MIFLRPAVIRRAPSLLAAALLLLAAACASAPPAPSPGPVISPPPDQEPHAPPIWSEPTPVPPPPPAGNPPPGAVAVSSLSGWADEDHRAALHAYAAGCGVARDAERASPCAAARALDGAPITRDEARAFFEARFWAVQASGGPDLLTSYFAPEYPARRERTAEFDAPVLAPPPGWSRGQTLPNRAAIEADPTPALAWMRAEDLFFMQIQGSGYLTFEDGYRARAAYAADNGHRFVGIARPMAERGLLPTNGTSGEAIRGWLSNHRGPEARAVMALNPRYIFFRMDPDDGGHPAGAAGVPLTARRSIAVDPAHWRYGDLVWFTADGGNLAGARRSYQGLAVALDTGSAIRGSVRADYYMGRGDAAGDEAGSVRHPLRMWRLVPR